MAEAAEAVRLERAEGSVALAVARSPRGSEARTVRQAGCLRVRFPRGAADGSLEAILLNNAGGLTGGDALELSVDLAAGASARVSSAAAEKIYRALHGEVAVATRLEVGPGAALEWLPQETILFDGSRLRRSLEIMLGEDASLLAVEAVLLGRLAMGERVTTGRLVENWRVRCGGRLVFAEALRLDGDIAALAGRPAVLGGATAFATLLGAGPHAASGLEPLREALETAPAEAGASLREGLLICRMAAPNGAALRATLARALAVLRPGRPLPRAWTI